MNLFDVLGKSSKQKSNMHAVIPALIKLDLSQEVVQTVIRYNPISILFYFMCKHRSPIGNALKVLKGIISVTQWITFFTLNSVTGLVFGLRVCKHSRAHSREFFVLRAVP